MGQGSYAAGGTFQDAFARYATSLGLKVISLDLPPVESAGYVSENADRVRIRSDQKLVNIKLREVLSLVNYAINSDLTDPESSQVVSGLKTSRYGASDLDGPPLDPRFSHLHIDNILIESSALPTRNWLGKLNGVTTFGESVQIICDALAEKLSEILGMAKEDVHKSKSIRDHGADSLVAVELRNWLQVELKADVPMLEILKTVPLAEFAATVAKLSEAVNSGDEEQHIPQVPDQTTSTIKQESPVDKVQRILDSYCTELSSSLLGKVSSPPAKTTNNDVLLLTGASGSLGAVLLDVLATSSKFVKVYALVRGQNGAEKIARSFARNQQDWNAVSKKLDFEILTYDMTNPFLGLDIDTYTRLSMEVTVVIHNAWSLDFSKELEEFEDPYLLGKSRSYASMGTCSLTFSRYIALPSILRYLDIETFLLRKQRLHAPRGCYVGNGNRRIRQWWRSICLF